MSELLPCPFCGGNAEPEVYAWNDARVECMACGYACTMAKDEPTAIAAWNRRAPVQASEARGDDKTETLPEWAERIATKFAAMGESYDAAKLRSLLAWAQSETNSHAALISAHTQAGPVG